MLRFRPGHFREGGKGPCKLWALVACNTLWVPATPAKAMWHFIYTYLPNTVTVAETALNKVTQAVQSLYSWLLRINLMLLPNRLYACLDIQIKPITYIIICPGGQNH